MEWIVLLTTVKQAAGKLANHGPTLRLRTSVRSPQTYGPRRHQSFNIFDSGKRLMHMGKLIFGHQFFSTCSHWHISVNPIEDQGSSSPNGCDPGSSTQVQPNPGFPVDGPSLEELVRRR